MRQYGKYAKPYLSAFILGPIFMIVEVLGEVALPRLMSVIINYGCGEAPGTEARGTGFILLIGAVMILTALLMMLGGVLGAYFAVKASVNFAADLRRDVFGKVQKFSFANIEKFSTGSLVTRLTNDITNVQNVIAMGLSFARDRSRKVAIVDVAGEFWREYDYYEDYELILEHEKEGRA